MKKIRNCLVWLIVFALKLITVTFLFFAFDIAYGNFDTFSIASSKSSSNLLAADGLHSVTAI